VIENADRFSRYAIGNADPTSRRRRPRATSTSPAARQWRPCRSGSYTMRPGLRIAHRPLG
jgi:hypothetical protein